MLKRIKYSCLKCNWQDSIIEAWKDLKPKKCPKCKTEFRKHPELLKIELPEDENLDQLQLDAEKVLK
jgi:hypothetical protein